MTNRDTKSKNFSDILRNINLQQLIQYKEKLKLCPGTINVINSIFGVTHLTVPKI